jgi:polysaccharide export outer membrane protein
MLRRVFLLLALALVWGAGVFPYPATAGESAPNLPAFTLGPGDKLHVSVWNEDSLTVDVMVRPDGYISYPLIGDVLAGGREVEALRQDLADRLKQYVPDSPVTVILAELGSARVYVVGKVTKPGMFLMPGRLRIMQALAQAGGVTPFADTTNILVLRGEGNTRKAIPFNYEDVCKGRGITQDIVLEPGDTVVVP